MERHGQSPALEELRSAEIAEVLRVATELQARDQVELEWAARQRELRDAAEEVGLPAEYLERAAGEIAFRRAARQQQRRRRHEGAERPGVGAAAALLLGVGAALFLTRPAAFDASHLRPLPLAVEGRFAPLSDPLPVTLVPTGHFAPLDLSNQITHSLDQPMLDRPGNDLSALGAGVITLAGIPFRLDGVILVGAPARGVTAAVSEGDLPREVDGIPVSRRARRLYFLHATHFSAAPGTRIGAYMVRYHDGTQAEIPIRYGTDVLDCWARPGTALEPALSHVAWTGRNAAAAASGDHIRLFLKRWENPHPERTIDSLDMLAGDQPPGPTAPAPFLVAVTAD